MQPSDPPSERPAEAKSAGQQADSSAMLARAKADHAEGRLSDAEGGYRAILEANPNQAEALGGLGVLSLRAGALEAAIEYLSRAVAADGRVPAFHNNLGEALRSAGRMEDAAASYTRAIERDPNYVQALTNLARVEISLGLHVEARRRLLRVIELQPENPMALTSLGRLALAEKDGDAALRHFQAALAARPGFEEAKRGLEEAVAMATAASGSAGEADESEELLDEVENEAPPPDPEDTDTDALIMQGLTLVARGMYDEAEHQLRAVLEQDARRGGAHLGLGQVMEARDKLPLAIMHYQTATVLSPAKAEAFRRLGDAYMAVGNDKAALGAYDKALRLDPKNALAHYHETLALLASGGYGRGWQGYEWRWRVPGAAAKNASLPAWDGKTRTLPSGAPLRLLVEDEGDGAAAIFYAHCLADLQATGIEVGFRGDPARTALFARSFPGLKALTPDASVEGFDAGFPLGSLPALFRRRRTAFKRSPGYLIADLRATTTWRERYRALGPGLKLGLSWHGDAVWPARHPPHIPLAELAPLLRVPGIHGAGLEQDPGSDADARALERSIQLGRWPERANDVDSLAARIDAADMVVAPPGRIAALAGALGKPVFVLTPPVPGWLWLLAGRKLPWFPTMTILRQRPGQGWRKIVATLVRELTDGGADSDSAAGS